MANLIDETEDLLILLLLTAIVAVCVWAAFKVPDLLKQISDAWKGLKDSLPSPTQAKDVALGGAGTPGQPGYVSGEENVSRWNGLLFGTGKSDADEYTPEQQASMGQLVDDYQMPDYDDVIAPAVDDAPATISDFFNTLRTDPAKLQLGNSPLF